MYDYFSVHSVTTNPTCFEIKLHNISTRVINNIKVRIAYNSRLKLSKDITRDCPLLNRNYNKLFLLYARRVVFTTSGIEPECQKINVILAAL